MKLALIKIQLVVAALLMTACQSISVTPTKDSRESSAAEQELVAQGIELHQMGEYARAEQRYLQVLAANPDNAYAIYELAFALAAQGKNKEAMNWAEKGLHYRSSSRDELIVLKANLLDNTGDTEMAIALYAQGLTEFPNSAGLHYNYGVTLLNQQRADSAIYHFKKNLQLRPGHASGHLALGMTLSGQNNRTEAILALLRFLSLEPESERSGKVLDELRVILTRGISVKKDKSGKADITIGPTAMGTSENDLGLALMAAVFVIEVDESNRHEQLSMIVSMLANPKIPIKADAMVQSHYVDFLKKIYENEHQEAFVYYIEQSRSERAKKWLKENVPEVGLFEVFSRKQIEMLQGNVISE